MWVSGWRWVCAVAAIGAALTVLEGSAQAAFPGRDGLLAVQPVTGRGVVLARANGRAVASLCTRVSVCGHPRNPRFSPDGRSIVFSGPAVRIIGTDGSCVDCAFGNAANPAFLPSGTLLTFVSGGGVFEDGIDRLRRKTVVSVGSGASDAVWSVRGKLALVRAGRVWVGWSGRLFAIGAGASPSWSPSGSRLAIARRGWIEVIGAAGRGWPRRLARGSAPAFSPDGRSVAFIGAQDRIELVSSSGGRAHPAGTLRGRSVDWQPVPRHAPPACVPPAGSQVVALSTRAVVTVADANLGVGLPSEAAMGCLFADGRERFLEGWFDNNPDGATNVTEAVFGGPYAALVSRDADGHYMTFSDSASVFDLRTGVPAGHGGESVSCQGADVTCTGIDGIVVGRDGVSAVHVGAGPTPPGAGTDVLPALTCGPPTVCIASDRFGQVDYSADPAVSPWTAARVASLSALSCPSASLCVGASGSSIYTSTDPGAGASSWSSVELPGGLDIQAISCASLSLCVAASFNGDLAVSSDPTGPAPAWTIDAVDVANTLDAISCPTTSECVAADAGGKVITSTDPTGGPGAWTVHQAAPSGAPITSVSCPSASLCLALESASFANPKGGAIISTAPTSGQWTSTNVPFSPSAVSCPSISLCVASAGSFVDTSTAPASGAWTSYPLTGEELYSISCPTTALCVGSADDNGDALVSTDPTGGPASWTSVLADPVSCSLTPFGPCGTEQIIASDRTGVHVVDSTTEFEPQAGPQLTGLALSGDTLTWHHSGVPRMATLEP